MQKGGALILPVEQDAGGRGSGRSRGGAPRTKANGEPWGPRLGIKKALQSEQATALHPAVSQTAFAWSLQLANSGHPATVCLEKPCSPA